jgi:hypothetical protein
MGFGEGWPMTDWEWHECGAKRVQVLLRIGKGS